MFLRMRKKSQPKKSGGSKNVKNGSQAQSTSKKNKSRPHSAPCFFWFMMGKKEKRTETKLKRERSFTMDDKDKTPRRNSFMQWLKWHKIKKDTGKTLRQIGDDLESSHSNSSLNVSSRWIDCYLSSVTTHVHISDEKQEVWVEPVTNLIIEIIFISIHSFHLRVATLPWASPTTTLHTTTC